MCLRVALQAARMVCSQFVPQDDASPTAASGARGGAAAATAPYLYVRISHAALPYIIMQTLELLQMSNKAEFHFNSSLMKSFISDSLLNVPPPHPLSSTLNVDDQVPPPPPSKRRIAAAEAQLQCSAAVAEKVLRLADLRTCNLQTFTTSITRELGLQALLVDVKSRDPELKTKRAKRLIKIIDLQNMVFDHLGPVDSVLPLLQGRAASAAGACHVIFKYDCMLDLPKDGGSKWQGASFQIALATPQSSPIPLSVPVWEDVGGGGIYDVTQQSALVPRDAGKVWSLCARGWWGCCIALQFERLLFERCGLKDCCSSVAV
jgi:hypothetical protein